MKYKYFLLLVFISVAGNAADVKNTAKSSFHTYYKASDHIYVFDKDIYMNDFSKETQENPENGIERTHMAVIRFNSDITAYVDLVAPTINGRTYIELVNYKDGKTIGELDLGYHMGVDFENVNMLFNGAGVVYLESTPLSICQGYGTSISKHVYEGGQLSEVRQPIMYLAAKARVMGSVALYADLKAEASKVVANLVNGTDVMVIGVADREDRKNSVSSPLLIKTPLGLTGWFIEGTSNTNSGTGIDILNCG